MSLFDDILKWATQLKGWQRDALRRLVQKQTLGAHDFDDLYAMLRSAHGLSDPKNRLPVPLAKEHLPVVGRSHPLVRIREMRDLKDVNRIAPGQSIDFAPVGMTIVYGCNASGKSGYSRVLKRACRARDQAEPVHTDASDPKSAANIPEATFEVETGGKATTLLWKRDSAPPGELSTISVFDGRCARAYLDSEQEVAYLPYGLDIVENLGQQVIPNLGKRLDAEIEAINTDTTPFADLAGDTTVGKIITSLSATSDQDKIRVLSALSDDDTQRLERLNRTLAEPDPGATARAFRLLAQRMEGLTSRIDSAVAWCDDAAISKIKKCDDEAESASRAEMLTASAFRASETLLPGTGEQVWKSLFEAARRFSTEVAFPDKPFPHIDVGARCLLCQQPFDQAAAKRLERFEAYVRNETAKVASEKRARREAAIQMTRDASLAFGLDTAMADEIKQHSADLLAAVKDYEYAIATRRAWILRALQNHAWEQPPTFAVDPRASLKSLSERLVAQAVELDKSCDAKQKQVLESERSELAARKNLSSRYPAVLALIERMRIKNALANCRGDLKTKGISNKARDLANKAVTEALSKALNTEFDKLGVGSIKVQLKERVEQGRMKHKLVLALPVMKPLNEILSDGEQRAIAIGSFLAELHLAGHKGAIVFDDPVSSLDHHWRKKVAFRLADEAKTRQVIVFTHDTVFLGELRHAMELLAVNHRIHHLECVDGCPGHVSEGLPWEHQSYKERLDDLEKAQKTLAKSWPVYPGEDDRTKMRHAYDLLRATIERVIQDLMFNGVVERYRDWIKVGNLVKVAGLTDQECGEIVRLHNACSDVVDAHDHSSAKDASVPDAVQLGKDIQDLKRVIDMVKAGRKP